MTSRWARVEIFVDSINKSDVNDAISTVMGEASGEFFTLLDGSSPEVYRSGFPMTDEQFDSFGALVGNVVNMERYGKLPADRNVIQASSLDPADVGTSTFYVDRWAVAAVTPTPAYDLQTFIDANAGGSYVVTGTFDVFITLDIPAAGITLSGSGVIRGHNLSVLFDAGGTDGFVLDGPTISGESTCMSMIQLSASATNMQVLNCDISYFMQTTFDAPTGFTLTGGAYQNNTVHHIGDASIPVITAMSLEGIFGTDALNPFEISGNDFQNIGLEDGDWLGYATGVFGDIYIHDNTASNCEGGGWKIDPGAGSPISGIVIENEALITRREGAYMGGPLDAPQLLNNDFTCDNTCIRVYGGCDDYLISGGTLTLVGDGNSRRGIYLQDANDGGTIDGVTIVGNSALCGIMVRECSNATISNIVSSGSQYGVYQQATGGAIQTLVIDTVDHTGLGSTGSLIYFEEVDDLDVSGCSVQDVLRFFELSAATAKTNVLIENNDAYASISRWGSLNNVSGTVQNNIAHVASLLDFVVTGGSVTLTNNALDPP